MCTFSRFESFPSNQKGITGGFVQEGYDLGDLPGEAGSLEGLGEAIVTALKMQDDQRAIAGGSCSSGVQMEGAN